MRNLHAKSCECAMCMAGSDHADDFKDSALELHAECEKVRECDSAPPPPDPSDADSAWTCISTQPVDEYDACMPAQALAELIDKATLHCRFGFAECCGADHEGADNAMHCRVHGLSDPEQANLNDCHKCAEAGHGHAMTCSECNAILHVCEFVDGMIRALQPHHSVEAVQAWQQRSVDHHDGMLVLLGHKMRSVHQDSARDEVIRTMGMREVQAFDSMMKLLPHQRTEIQADSFGKNGTSTHGAVAQIKALPPELKVRAVCCSQEKHFASLSLPGTRAGARGRLE